MENDEFRSFVRRYVPRTLRNSLRNSKMTLGRVRRRMRSVSGQTDQVEVRKGWGVRCRPLSVEAFTQFRIDLSQRAETEAFVASCTPGMQLLDIGAHWGFITLAGLHFGGQAARSVAVEPSANAVAVLKINVELNVCADRTVVVNKAAGQMSVTIEMLTTGAGGNDYFIVPCEKRLDVCTVPQTTIDEICNGLVYRPTHIKIDVEGFKAEVLRGGQTLLSMCQPIIFLELHGDIIRARGQSPEEPLSLLESFGYRRYELDGRTVMMQQLSSVGYVARLVCSAR